MQEGIFALARKNARDISDRFYEDLGQAPEDIATLESADRSILEAVRSAAESTPSFGSFRSISDLAGPFLETADRVYRNAEVVALDGSNAMQSQDFISGSHVCIAVVEVSPRGKRQHISLTSTTATNTDWSIKDLTALTDRLEQERDKQQSWISTFREWCVRKRAIELLPDFPVVLIDGPVFTQNMLTQKETDDDRLALANAPNHVLGFIKELSANPIMHVIGCTLREGECFLYQDYRSFLIEKRFKQLQSVGDWVRSYMGDWTRVVYRLRHRAFGIECREKDIGLALAVATIDASMKIGHEIPCLLELADQAVRRIGQDGRIGEMALSRGLRDLDQIFNLSNERNFR